jgi:succinyl-CoA synthetase alpha subunit
MAHQSKRAMILTEIAELQKQNSEANITAIYVGWTAAGDAARNKRDARLSLLHRQLTEFDQTSRG